MSKSSRVPKYSLHKATGQARVCINGRDHYLGEYNSPESKRKYREKIDEWRRGCPGDGFPEMTVGQLTMMYLQHAERWYVKNGRPTSQVHSIRGAFRALNKLFRSLPIKDFGPLRLRQVRDEILASGCCRETINRNVRRIVKAWRWAVAQEYLSPTVVVALETVEGLQAGRCTARDPEPVKPVPVAVVDATLPFVRPDVAGAIRVQLHTGMRPSEVLTMRGADLNTSGGIWEYRPRDHKMSHRGKSRVVAIGPKAQSVLREFLRADLQSFLFSSAKDHSRPYTSAGYRWAIMRACEKAFGLPKGTPQRGPEVTAWRHAHCWHPNQLRHTFGTLARREGGIEVARTVLGHSSAVTTEIYAERDLQQAREVVAKIG